MKNYNGAKYSNADVTPIGAKSEPKEPIQVHVIHQFIMPREPRNIIGEKVVYNESYLKRIKTDPYVPIPECGYFTITEENGYGRCISCGKIIHWKDADAGHYVNRKHLSLRYDEKNVNIQCQSCNRFDEGNMIGYNHGLVEKYGDLVVDYLVVKKFNFCHMGKVEYETLIDYYKQRIKVLKETKI